MGVLRRDIGQVGEKVDENRAELLTADLTAASKYTPDMLGELEARYTTVHKAQGSAVILAGWRGARA